MNTAQQQLIQLKKALQIERDEDFKQYQEHFKKNNINYRKEQGVTWYPIVITSEEIGMGDYLILEVDRTNAHNTPHQFSSGKNVELFSNTTNDYKPVTGTAKNVLGNKMRIALNVDELPDWTADGKLGINLLFDDVSYKEMQQTLDKVIQAENNRLADLRDIAYGIKEAYFTNEQPFHFNHKLNQSQNEAIEQIAKANDIAIIHGPPGTGKTTTLVEAIRQTLMHEKQVLVVSPSNTAVDLLTEKLTQQGLEVLRLGNPARISDEVLNSTLDVRISKHTNYKDIKSLRKTAEEYRRMASKYKRQFGKAEREQRNLLYAEAKKISSEVYQLEDYITAEQFSKCQVIACTPVASAGRHLQQIKFKTVFIDEAAQALEPMCWIPISKSERVIFAGDHLQLPPTVKSNAPESKILKETLFEKIMQRNSQVSTLLSTQYRMNEKIMQFSNEQFYNNKLIANLTVKDNLLSYDAQFLFLHTPVEFVDTAGCGYTEQINPESLSTSNTEEAQLLLKHLQALLKEYQQAEPNKPITVGVIAPYKEQITYLEKELASLQEELFFEGLDIKVKTIDGFQGQERDVIYISMTRSNEAGEIGFLSDTRRMNVALTRAKKKLVVIGDSATLGNNIFYQHFLNYIEKIDAYKSAWDYMYLLE